METLNKSSRVLRIMEALKAKRGRWHSVANVMSLMEADHTELRKYQRYLKMLAEQGDLEMQVEGHEKAYRIPALAAKVSFAELKENDFFSFLLLSRIQKSQLKGAGQLDKWDQLAAKGSSDSVALHGKDVYQNFYGRFSELVTFAGEEAAQSPDEMLVPILLQGLTGHRVLEIAYQSMGSEKPVQKSIEPWHLLVYRNELYFLCPRSSDRSVLVRYKLSRILTAKLSSVTFQIDFALLHGEIDFLKQSVGLFSERSAKVHRIQLHFAWGMRLFLQERKIHRSQRIKVCHAENPDERFVEMTLETCISEDLLDWIRRWGDQVEVVAPKALRRQMRIYGKWLTDTYE